VLHESIDCCQVVRVCVQLRIVRARLVFLCELWLAFIGVQSLVVFWLLVCCSV